MVGNDLCYVGCFFVLLEGSETVFDVSGYVMLNFFVVDKLSCYLLIVFVSDGVVYCVIIIKEIFIECGLVYYFLSIVV